MSSEAPPQEHVFARIKVAPDAQEVMDAMKQVHNFQDAVNKITYYTRTYKEMVHHRQQTLAVKTEKEYQAELDAVQDIGKRCIGKYLKVFNAEYLEYGKNELRTWSFPKIVWEHFQEIVRGLYPNTDCPERRFCFNTYGITPVDNWDIWAGERHDVPPFLKVYNRIPTTYSDQAWQEMEICKIDVEGRDLQFVYQVWCGPRLCGTLNENGTCRHAGHMHQFTKRPREWVDGGGWKNGSPYQIGHEASADLNYQHWVAIFDMEDGQLVRKRDYDWTEFYDVDSMGHPTIS